MLTREDLKADVPTVVIIAPPWPRGGTSRVVQSQIDFYKDRGYNTVLICVPLHWTWTTSHPEWNDTESGMRELGADYTVLAPIDRMQFRRMKYLRWFKRRARRTALDWIVATADSARVPAELIQDLRRLSITLVHINHVFTIRFAEHLIREVMPNHRGIPIIVETHDVQGHALADRGEENLWTHRVDSRDSLVSSELSYLRGIRVLIHLSEDDFRFFQSRLPSQTHLLALPTIDESFIAAALQASPVPGPPIDLLFLGQRTATNCAALEWFYQKVWPLIADRRFEVRIVGQIDSKMREMFPATFEQHKGCFVGPVDDIAPFYAAARCVFAPMVSGTGISIKTIEALALGKPFIGTSKAYRGMPMQQIHQAGLRVYDTPNEFANAIVDVLSGNIDLASAGRRAYASLFSKRAAYVGRDRALSSALAVGDPLPDVVEQLPN